MFEKLKTQLEKDLAEIDKQYLKDIQEAKNEYKYISASESWKLEIQLQVIKDSYETMKQALIRTSTAVLDAYKSAVESVENTKTPLFRGSEDVKNNVLDALKRVSGN